MGEALAIATAATAGVTALCQVKPTLWDPLVKKISSSKNVNGKLDALNEAIGVLQSRKKDYENEIETRKTKVPSATYKQWIFRVNNIEDQVKDLIAKNNKQSKKTSLLLSSSSTLVKQIQKIGEQVGKLLEEGDQLEDKLFTFPKLEPVVKTEAPEIKKFDTLQEPLEQILNLLKNNKVNGIGICGPLGIGKTTIMWNLNNHEEVAKMYDIVIWVKVSTEGSKENLSRKNLQEVIVRRLKIEMEGTSNAEEVSERISMVLKCKKYLILFDDVKEHLNLYQLGIPDNKNGSKFVMTTRLHHVCSSMVDRVFKVKYLSVDEAWKMFQDVLQNPKLISNSKVGPLAWRVCKECYGLPLLIEKVANTFKWKNNECLWSDGLNSWRMWPEKDCQGIKEIYELLKFCYNDLDDDWQKKCFLYGALYPEDSDIYTDYLLECWAAEDFLGNDCDATKVRVMKGHLILGHLKSVSLLEEGKTENHVTMQKIIRQLALYISEDNPECKYLVKTNGTLREPLEVGYWSEKNMISLCVNDLDQLPDSPDCSSLSTLFLQNNWSLKEIPDSFFEHMICLRVLDLSHTGIMSLPSSISISINLKVLYLNNCKCLLELPSHVVELVHLEALDIQGSGVNNIPPNIEKLTRLRRLRVSFSKSGNENITREADFNYNVISKLSRLEELVIYVKSPEQWSNKVVENIIKEVATLIELKTLKFCFPNKVIDVIEVTPMTLRIRVPKVAILLNYVEMSSWRNVHRIKSFKFFIGCQNSEHPQIPNFVRYEKYVKYCGGAGSNFQIPQVLVEADAFELANHEDIKQLSDFGITSMNKVQACLIESCDAIETIMDTPLLPNLEHLYLMNLPKLESIWKVPVQPGSLTKLRNLVLTSCFMLVEIFPLSVIQQLCEIQYLKIEKCQEIEEIITESDAVGNLLILPKLKKLILLDLPKLRRICAIETLKWPSLEKLKIFKCPSLSKLPFNEDNAAKLMLIKTEQHWWEALQWQSQVVKERLQKFCILK